MVEPYTIFFPVCVRYDESNNHIYVTDKRNREWDCWIASPSDKKPLKKRAFAISKVCSSMTADMAASRFW